MCNLAQFNEPKKRVEVDPETLEGYNVQDVPVFMDDPIDIERTDITEDETHRHHHEDIIGGGSEELKQPILDDDYGFPEDEDDVSTSQYGGDNYYRDDYGDYDYDYDYRADMIEEPCCFWPWFAKSKKDEDAESNISDPSVPFRQFTRNMTSPNVSERGNNQQKPRVPRSHYNNSDNSRSSSFESAPSFPPPEPPVECADTDAAAGPGAPDLVPLPSRNARPKKSILKRNSVVAPLSEVRRSYPASSSSLSKEASGRRRSLFTNTYDSRGTKKSAHVRFSPMAKVTYVVSCAEMSLLFKSFIWWQKSDFEEFKKTARMIAKAMVTGGSEIWLQTSDVWHVPKGRRDGGTASIVGTATNNGSNDEEQPDATDVDDDHGQKWWCKFGHSRRGLEHIVCQNEGRQRQQNVALAISAVIGEYARQKHLHTNDEAKLASVSARYTSWARDLALAAGLADADAVKQNFGSRAKTRSFYLGTAAAHSTAAWQLALSQGRKAVTVGHLTASLTSSEFSPTILDANTSSHIVTVPKTTVKKVSEEERNKSIAKTAAAYGGRKTSLLITAATIS